MGTVSFQVPGPGSYQVTCDPKLDPLANNGTPEDVLFGKQFYNDQNQIVTGTITAQEAQTITPGAIDQTIPAGKYLIGDQTISGDPDLVPGNIKAGVEIFGVTGSLAPEYAGVLVVTVDAGAEVTATDGTTTLTETSTGTATFHLPNGGTWTVSATLNGNESAPAQVEVQENFSLALSAGATQTVNIPTQYEAEIAFTPVPIYVGKITQLIAGANYLAATTVGGYALFGGGLTGRSDSSASYYSTVVTAYDEALIRTKPANLGTARYDLAATAVGDYALFGGGHISSNLTSTDAVDSYDNALTHRTMSLSAPRVGPAATKVGDYALFGGGLGREGASNVVDAFDTSLVRTSPTVLRYKVKGLSATTVGDYALFAGGRGASSSSTFDTVNAYNTSLTRTIPTPMSVSRSGSVATAVGGYALICGGASSDVVDAYDESLVRTTPTPLSAVWSPSAATTVVGFALFAGGGYSSASGNAVEAYDESLTRTALTPLSVARNPAATTLGIYALFGGGLTGSFADTSSYSPIVEAYTVQ